MMLLNDHVAHVDGIERTEEETDFHERGSAEGVRLRLEFWCQ